MKRAATAAMWGETARDPALLRVVCKRSDIQISDLSADDWSRLLAQMLACSLQTGRNGIAPSKGGSVATLQPRSAGVFVYQALAPESVSKLLVETPF